MISLATSSDQLGSTPSNHERSATSPNRKLRVGSTVLELFVSSRCKEWTDEYEWNDNDTHSFVVHTHTMVCQGLDCRPYL